METKIIRSLLFINAFFIPFFSYSQTANDKIKYMKKYAYCDCIYVNNNKFDTEYLNDKFQISDKSSNQFIHLGKIYEDESKEIRKFTEKITASYYFFESSYYSENGRSNTITSMCLEFYESKELDDFIRKLSLKKK
ncbi:MAG: hypothetical protein EOO44_18585 [Flavobacterium sp.]|nr:MAG: hypothetical protein EOO44_18585 [Flavobacterium sp.]